MTDEALGFFIVVCIWTIFLVSMLYSNDWRLEQEAMDRTRYHYYHSREKSYDPRKTNQLIEAYFNH